MHCTEILNNLDDYLDSDLPQDVLQRMESHLQQCEQCRAELQHARNIQAALQQQTDISMRPGFAQQAFKHAARVNRQAKKSHHWFAAGFGSALAAGVVLAVLLGPMRTLLIPQASVNAISMSVQEEKNLRVVFQSPEDIQGVELELVLTDGLELAGRPGKRNLRWKTDLKAGKNRLVIPVRALRSGSEALLARMRNNGQEKEFRITLDISDAAVNAGEEHTLWI